MELDIRSLSKLATCDPRLVRIIVEAQSRIPRQLKVLFGERDAQEQNALFDQERSQVRFPNSKHNVAPGIRDKAEAVDVCFADIDWELLDKGDKVEWGRCYYLIGVIWSIAVEMGFKIRPGGDWDGDFELKDQKFYDLCHIEIIN